MNLELQSWGNRGPSLWKIDLQQISLIQGQSTYNLPVDTAEILDVYIQTQQGGGDPVNRIILPISRTDYAMFPDTVQQAPPTVYWYDRTESPTITFWQPPDQNGPYTAFYYRQTKIQDAYPTMGQTPDVTFLFLDALCAGVASRLALKYRPELFTVLKSEAKEAWMMAAEENREFVDFYIRPNLDGYYPP